MNTRYTTNDVLISIIMNWFNRFKAHSMRYSIVTNLAMRCSVTVRIAPHDKIISFSFWVYICRHHRHYCRVTTIIFHK
jgi:hypothetical protein